MLAQLFAKLSCNSLSKCVMNSSNTSFSDLAASIADGAAIDWKQLKSRTTDAPELAFLAQLETISRIGELRWSQLQDQPTRKATPNANGHRVTESAASSDGALRFQRWGHLEILKRIGGGGFGEVYRARDPRLEREVALKLLRREREQATSLDSSVLKEGRLLARLHHPNVATIYGVDQHEGRVGLWMELVRGKTLEARLQEQGPSGAREAVGIGLDLCRALAAVHGAGLIHGDIKAQNVMREEGGRIVLADFGLGRDVSQDLNEPLQGGTPLYMAPELLRGEPATIRSDIYALGHSGKIVRSEAELQSFMIRRGNRLSRFEVGELYYWLSDALFVEIVGDLASAWQHYKPPKKLDDDFYASVALTLFDKQFRDAIIAARSDENQIGGRALLAKENLEKSFNFNLQQSDIDALANFLTDAEVASPSMKKVSAKSSQKKAPAPRAVEKSPAEKPSVQKSFRILEGLGWSPVCFEGLSFDKSYKHVHPNSRFMAHYNS
jgi:serine/threonine protein kinase